MRRLASILDYPRADLDEDLFDIGEDIKLKSDIKDEIEDVAYSMVDDVGLPDEAIKSVLIYGSIMTNQWNPTTDVDCRIILEPEAVYEEYGVEITGDVIFDMVIEKVHDVPLGGTKHPLNCTIVIEGEETEIAKSQLGRTEEDPVYDVLKDEFINPPFYRDEEFDPDVEFKEEKDETTKIMDTLDKLIQETRTDSIDFKLIQDAVKDVKSPGRLVSRLEEKLKEIETDVAQLVEEYETIKEERGKSYKEDAPGHGQPGNIRMKYLERYKYLDVLRQLKRLFKEGIEEEEVTDIEEVVSLA